MFKKDNSLFSGVVIHTFDNGKISGKFTYRNGKLYGKWITFDHQGDKVQEGKYLVDERIENYLNKLDFSKSTSLCLTQEGNYDFLELNIDLINLNEKNFDTISNYINNHFFKIYFM
ncbi:MAG: hypothetical protein HC892_10770 [Saprospiraceae bacterium]|nr:hypothetical protein [Saprospiraceae bacterium]